MELVKYRTQLVNYARSMVGSDAEDVVSDLSVYLLQGRFNAPPEPIRLLMWYTKRKCIDHLRKKVTTEELPREFQDEEQDLGVNDRLEYLDAAMSQLHPFVAKVLVLNAIEGISRKKLAAETNISQYRLMYILHTAKKLIRENEQKTRFKSGGKSQGTQS
jgi:RNA polymerase sigma factor (sigma-70 family)